MKNNKNPYYITLDDIRARSTPGAVKVLEGSSGGKMPNTTEKQIEKFSITMLLSSSALTISHIHNTLYSYEEL